MSHAIIRKTSVVCCLLLLTVSAAIADDINKKFALVIGNSQYERISSLKNAANDADLVSNTLQKLGFEVSLLKNVTSQQLENAVYQFGEKLVQAQQGEAILFFYSGHGLQNSNGSQLLPIDYSPENSSSGVILQDILLEFQNGSFGTRIIIIDACRNDNVIGQNRLTFNNQFSVPKGTLLAFSTGSSEPAVDGTGPNSPYTESLVTAMMHPGLEIAAIFRETRKNVSRRTNNQQQPQQTNALNDEFYFTKSSKPATSVNFIAQEHQAWTKIKNSNVAQDYLDFIKRFPDGEFSDMAHTRYRQLETSEPDHAMAKSKYGVVLVYQASLTDAMALTVADVVSESVLSGKLMRNDIVLQINHKPLPDGQNPHRILDDAFDSTGRLDLLVKRGASVYNISIRK